MTITTTILNGRGDHNGPCRVVYGKTVCSDGVSGGDIITGLKRIRHFRMTAKAAVNTRPQMNHDFPLASGTVTFATDNLNETVYWEAVGDPV